MTLARAFTASAVLSVACSFSSTLPEYEEARARALAAPPALPTAWKPDAAILISPRAMGNLTSTVLEAHGTLDTPIPVQGFGKVIPDLTIRDATVKPSKACPTCLAVDLTIDGTVQTDGAIKLTSPLAATIGVDVELEGTTDGKDHVVTLRARDVRRVDVSKTSLPAPLEKALSNALVGEARKALVDQAKPREVARLPAGDLPLRALRTATDGQAVRIDLRTSANATADLELANTPPRSGWIFAMTQESMLALARAEAMKQGPVSYDVVPEPTGLRITGDRFELDLRLWKTTGAGWWRDYTVQGRIQAGNDGIELVPGDIAEKGASKGALAADPLAALGGSVILSTIRESMQVSAPALHAADVGAQRALEIRVTSVRGAGPHVLVMGSLEPGPDKKPARRGGR
jgi:hypothetical protein